MSMEQACVLVAESRDDPVTLTIEDICVILLDIGML
jgi:hypothetical protein